MDADNHCTSSALKPQIITIIPDFSPLSPRPALSQKLESKRVSEQTGHALYQLTGVLRNLANVEATLARLVSSGATAQISSVLALFSADMDVISNVARILRCGR